MEDVLNINFSVALYENLFVLLDNLKTEYAEFQRQTDLAQKETIMLGSSKTATKDPFDSDKQAVFFNASTYFIKNKTGELLMFMAGKKPAFTEMQPNEILPLDFAKHTFEEYEQIAEDLDDGSNKCLFEGVPSSTDLQPNSDAPGTI